MRNMFGIDDHRAPLGRRKLFVIRYPDRWAGLRDDGPLGLNLSANGAQPRDDDPLGLNLGVNGARLGDDGPLGLNLSANGAQSLSPGQRPGFAIPTNIMRPEGPRYASMRNRGPKGRHPSAQPHGLGIRADKSCGLKGRDNHPPTNPPFPNHCPAS